MQANLYRVKRSSHPRDRPMYTNVWRQFELGEAGTADARCVVDDDRWSLWSLDFEKNGAVFVGCDSSETLLAAPLLYRAQYERARQIAWLDFDTFHRLADRLTIPVPTRDMVWLYSTGRCGSTLLQNILSRHPSVLSVSEADAHTSIALQRDLDALEAGRLLVSATRFLAHRFAKRDHLLLFKSRLEVARVWEIQERVLPSDKSLFLYRNAIDVAQSGDRLTGSTFHGRRQWKLRIPLLRNLVLARLKSRMSKDKYKKLRHVTDPAALRNVGLTSTAMQVMLKCGWCGEFVLSWLSCVGAYTGARSRGSAVVGLRYEDLTADAPGFLRALLSHLELPSCDLEYCLEAMHEDAHAGTALGRGSVSLALDARTRAVITSLIANETNLGSPHLVLANTLRPLSPPR